MLNTYKILAGHMIVESNNTKELKGQLLDFIKIATESQVKYFILSGSIIENIDKDSIELINRKFLEVYTEADPVAIVGGIALASIISGYSWLAWRMIGAATNKAKAKCGALSIGSRRKMCIAAVISHDQKKRITLLQKEIKNCKKTKNPEKCVQKLKTVIAKAQKKLQKQQAILKKGAMKGKDAAGAIDAVAQDEKRRSNTITVKK
jgi:hypothetical protein